MSEARGNKSEKRFRDYRRPSQLCNLERLYDTMERRGMDGLVSYFRPNVYYLSGFAPPSNVSVHETNGYAAVVISRHMPDHPILVVADFDVALLAEQPSWIENVRPFASLTLPFGVAVEPQQMSRYVPRAILETPWGQNVIGHYNGVLGDAVTTAMADLGLRTCRVGFDNLHFAGTLQTDAVEIVDAYGALKFVRQVKTPQEVELIRYATGLNQVALEGAIDGWEKGMTWQDVAHLYHLKVAELGGFVGDPSGMVQANPTTADPVWHTQAGVEEFEIKSGMNLMFDCHGTWNGYCWDGGKTWSVGGNPTAEASRASRAVGEAVREIQQSMRPGDKISALQARGQHVLQKAGIPNAGAALIFFHGLGLEHIDQELTESRQDWSIEDQMVVSTHVVYPGSPSERVFLEDIAVVTKQGAEPFYTWDYAPFNHG